VLVVVVLVVVVLVVVVLVVVVLVVVVVRDEVRVPCGGRPRTGSCNTWSYHSLSLHVSLSVSAHVMTASG
jgi:hypothetical protein